MDKERHTIDKLYLDTATLAWNGNPVDGINSIKSFLLDRLPKTSHYVNSLDSQPVADYAVGGQTTILVQVEHHPSRI
ncbi:NTF2-related export protein 2 [Eurytemora carolleeae]|uniref:NTF2-related export protein 2 n=1 Tax=Eurytemora carolleeae TaxID=1294199 RepID=UPI000C763108|nr:NTF2-related export protein 2 [Eurytemora carolleeae]|eukprot:XP_023345329.1 NTF2-related export protein 2-like [Eurytemora affinis]